MSVSNSFHLHQILSAHVLGGRHLFLSTYEGLSCVARVSMYTDAGDHGTAGGAALLQAVGGTGRPCMQQRQPEGRAHPTNL